MLHPTPPPSLLGWERVVWEKACKTLDKNWMGRTESDPEKVEAIEVSTNPKRFEDSSGRI